MNLPPIVERELRAAARRPVFYWTRGLLTVAACFRGYDMLERALNSASPAARAAVVGMAPPVLTGADVLHDLAWLVFFVTLFLSLLSADSISREKREGTLGFLLLSDLVPGQIVRGKLVSCGLTALMVLLGFLPALMFTLLAGGVSGAEAALTGLGLMNVLFVVLAGGLWISALFRERRFAMLATLGLAGVLAFGPELFLRSYLGASVVPVLRTLELAGWTSAARAAHLLDPQFLVWFGLLHGLGWLFLYLAARTLAARWQDRPHEHFRPPEPDEDWPVLPVSDTPVVVPARVTWLTDPRPWDEDPVRWRVERLGSPAVLVWLAVGANFFAQFGLVGVVFDERSAQAGTWAPVSFVGLVVMSVAGGLLAWVGGRFFQHTRRQQDLELLLTSPEGSRRILAGQWNVLRRSLAWPLGVVVTLALPAGIVLVYDALHGYREEGWFLAYPFLVAVNLVVESLALCWAGMRFGLRARTAMVGVAWTVGVVQLAPLLLAAGLAWSWVWLTGISPAFAVQSGQMPVTIPVLTFFMVKNAALMVWARRSLRRELRLGGRRVRQPEAARSTVAGLQPA